MTAEAELVLALHRAARLLATELSRFVATVAPMLTAERWLLLHRVRAEGPVRQRDLCDTMLDDAGNVSRLLGGLVAARLISRSSDPWDRRCLSVALTEHGETLLGANDRRTSEEYRRLVDGMTPGQIQDLMVGLARLQQNLTALLAIPRD